MRMRVAGLSGSNPWLSAILGRTQPSRTNIERLMARALHEAGVRYEEQKQIGPYRADFFLPDCHGVIEVDGTYWHKDRKEKDIRKDKFLRSCGYLVWRFDESLVKSRIDDCIRQVMMR